MCFSTIASFGAGALLTGAGIVAARNVDKPAQRAFAAIPFIFAAQQFSEGFVWLSLTQESFAAWQEPASYLFMVFAHVVWPSWVPFAFWKLEKDPWRRKILLTILGVGILLSSHLLYCLVAFPVDSRIIAHHIQYDLGSPQEWMVFAGIAYGVVTLAPSFISTVSRMWVFGLAVLSSYLITRAFFLGYLISVWCFFAAILSLLVIYYLSEMRKVSIARPMGGPHMP